MSVDDYRKQYAAELARAARAGRRRGAAATPSGPQAAAPAARAPRSDPLRSQITALKNAAAAPKDRLEALRRIQAATFLGPRFDRYRAAYRDALRAAATADDPELREASLELLAIDKDEVARDLLVKGLEGRDKQLVPPGKAVQLLAHDDHGVALPLARRIAEGEYDVEAKAEALRVLASDPGSDGLFARILSDASQPRELRSVSAAGLRHVNPQKFAAQAQNIVVDDSEPAEVRAACLGALAHMQGAGTITDDANFIDAVAKLEGAGAPAPLRAAARRFLQRRGT